jgi:hypothetical protein
VNVIEVVGEPVRGETPALSSLVGPLTAVAELTSVTRSSAIAAEEAASHDRLPIPGEDGRTNDKDDASAPGPRSDDEPEHGWRAGGPAMVRVSP